MKTETIIALAALLTTAAVNLDAGKETRRWVESIKEGAISVVMHRASVAEELGYAVSVVDTRREIAAVEEAGKAVQEKLIAAIQEVRE